MDGPSRPSVDFGRRADDYARHRPGFPAAFFDRVGTAGAGLAGQRVLDLGTGTGTLARGFAARGASATGLDPSPEMLREAAALARAEGVTVRWVRGWAEALPVRGEGFDLVCAGQCWHWFDAPRAAAELARALRAGGRALLASFSYLSDPGTPGAATEAIVLRHHPTWTMAGKDGRSPRSMADLTGAGLEPVEVFEFEVDVPFTHEAWRGRMRACNGVFQLPAEGVAAFDAELAAELARHHPEPLVVPHRVYGVMAERPLDRRSPPHWRGAGGRV